MNTTPTPHGAGYSERILLCIFLFVISGSLVLSQSIKKEPYLIYQGVNSAMDVCWQVTAPSIDTIKWRSDLTYSEGQSISAEYGADHQHRVTLTGLAPATLYQYQVNLQSGTSYTGSFSTAPPTTDSTLKFITYGDVRSNPSIHDVVADSILSAIDADPAYQTFLLVNGDLTVSGNNESSWSNEIFNPSYRGIRKLMASMPYEACMGNHEQSGVLYSKYFPYAFAGARYYSFDYGPLHVAVLDQYTSYAPGSAQYTWLESDLAGSNKPWKILSFHEPGWTAGGGHFNNTSVQTYIEPLCERYNVPLVITGHNHYYARARVIGADGDTVMHVTTGGGGAPLYTPDPNQPNIVKTFQGNHFCTVEITGRSSLNLRAIAMDGSTIEQFTVHHHTPVLTGVGASAISQRSASISWNTDISTIGILEWGTDDHYGNRVMGSAGVLTHSFSLSNLQPNSTYHYRVFSEDASSADSVFQTPPDPVRVVSVTFRVAMDVAYQKGLFKPTEGDYVTLRGTLNFWGDSTGNVDTMKDPGGTGIYTITRQVDSGTVLSWKYWKSPRMGAGYDIVTRSATLGGTDTTFSTVWFNDDSARPAVSVHLAAHWNLVSLPLQLADKYYSSVFPNAGSPPYSFQDGYHLSDSIQIGVGYWMKCSADTVILLHGHVIESDTVTVVRGWNLIGAVTDSVDAGAVTTVPPGITTGAYWGFENGYKQSGMLVPGKAYWIYVNSDGYLIVR